MIIDLQESLRARVNQMADEQMAMQEALHNLPPSKVLAHLDAMEKHASELSRLASRIAEVQAPTSFLPRDAGEDAGGGLNGAPAVERLELSEAVEPSRSDDTDPEAA